MPWSMKKAHPDCPSSRPVGVVDKNGKKVACHPDEAAAKKHIAALYANSNDTAEAAQALDEAMEVEERARASG